MEEEIGGLGGLEPGCVAKGRKEGTGGKVVKFIVAISYTTRE